MICIITEVFINYSGSPGEEEVSCALGHQRERSCCLVGFAFDFLGWQSLVLQIWWRKKGGWSQHLFDLYWTPEAKHICPYFLSQLSIHIFFSFIYLRLILSLVICTWYLVPCFLDKEADREEKQSLEHARASKDRGQFSHALVAPLGQGWGVGTGASPPLNPRRSKVIWG